jgi:hypothetical protein
VSFVSAYLHVEGVQESLTMPNVFSNLLHAMNLALIFPFVVNLVLKTHFDGIGNFPFNSSTIFQVYFFHIDSRSRLILIHHISPSKVALGFNRKNGSCNLVSNQKKLWTLLEVYAHDLTSKMELVTIFQDSPIYLLVELVPL